MTKLKKLKKEKLRKVNSFQKVYLQVKKIPKGKVSTYKAIAEFSGTTPRVVGFALHANKNPKEIPCHRIVNIKGEVATGYAFGGQNKQRETLENEGVMFMDNGKINLLKFGYIFNKS